MVESTQNPEIKAALLRKTLPAAFYKPNVAASDDFIREHRGMPGSRSRGDRVWFESDAQMRISVGGNRAGKTTKLILEIGSFCLGRRPWYPKDHPWATRGLKSKAMEKTGRPARCRYMVPSFKVHLPEVVNEFRKWWPDNFYSVTAKDERGNPSEFTWFNGSKIMFMSHHMSKRDVEGVESDLVCWDEPPPREFWTGLERGLVSTGGRTIMGCTLLDASGWFWEEIIGPNEDGSNPDVLITWHSIWDNTFENSGCEFQTAKNVSDWLCNKITDPDERLAREHGFPMHVGGLVLRDLSKKNIVDPFDLPPGALIVSAIDPAGSRPFAAIWIAYFEHEGSWVGHIFDECYMANARNDLGAFCQEFLAREHGELDPVHPYESVLTLIDPFSNEPQKADAMGRTMKDIIEEDYGIVTVDADRKNKRARLMRLNTRFRQAKYLVWSNCKRLLAESRRWTWDPDHSAKLTKGPDDLCDCISYVDHSDPPSTLMNYADGEGKDGVWVPPEYRERERRGGKEMLYA